MKFRLKPLKGRSPLLNVDRDAVEAELEYFLSSEIGKDSFIGFEIPTGWLSLVQNLHDSLIADNPAYTVSRIHVDNATLNFVAHSLTDRGQAFVKATAKESRRICEHCGRAGRVRDGDGYDVVLCLVDSLVERTNRVILDVMGFQRVRRIRRNNKIAKV